MRCFPEIETEWEAMPDVEKIWLPLVAVKEKVPFGYKAQAVLLVEQSGFWSVMLKYHLKCAGKPFSVIVSFWALTKFTLIVRFDPST